VLLGAALIRTALAGTALIRTALAGTALIRTALAGTEVVRAALVGAALVTGPTLGGSILVGHCHVRSLVRRAAVGGVSPGIRAVRSRLPCVGCARRGGGAATRLRASSWLLAGT
jgi:hypothetical protein